ncbi:MAG TPA: hypothetical protein VNS32_00160 [Flavisolibacter sp.]|nr:hypothetical protein [Flavisolibacter sp.]
MSILAQQFLRIQALEKEITRQSPFANEGRNNLNGDEGDKTRVSQPVLP